MHRQNIYLNYGENRPSINADRWSAGIYFVRILKEDGSSEVLQTLKQ